MTAPKAHDHQGGSGPGHGRGLCWGCERARGCGRVRVGARCCEVGLAPALLDRLADVALEGQGDPVGLLEGLAHLVVRLPRGVLGLLVRPLLGICCANTTPKSAFSLPGNTLR